MLDSTQPIPLDYQLPADAYWHLIRRLRLTLPPPPDDSAEALLKRDHAAIAQIAALAPGNSVEAQLAAQFVAASEQWQDCLRLVREPETTPEWALKYRAQAAGMMREANGAMRLLLRTQEARRRLQADNAACNRLEWTEHVATRLMAEALPGHAAQSADVAATPSPQTTSGLAAQPAMAAPGLDPAISGRHGIADIGNLSSPAVTIRGSAPDQAAPKPQQLPRLVMEPWPDPACQEPDPVAEAEHYAVLYPERAALIRRLGRVPDDVSFGPPDDDLVQALISADTPALAALDHAFAGPRSVASTVLRHGNRAA